MVLIDYQSFLELHDQRGDFDEYQLRQERHQNRQSSRGNNNDGLQTRNYEKKSSTAKQYDIIPLIKSVIPRGSGTHLFSW
jgi:hypothetical protein